MTDTNPFAILSGIDCETSHYCEIPQYEPQQELPHVPCMVQKSHYRCVYGWDCTRGVCRFVHPWDGKECKYGIDCRKIDCLFEHPAERAEKLVELSYEICKLDWRCKSHPERGGTCLRIHTPLDECLDNFSDTPCMWGSKCGHTWCPYKHPTTTMTLVFD